MTERITVVSALLLLCWYSILVGFRGLKVDCEACSSLTAVAGGILDDQGIANGIIRENQKYPEYRSIESQKRECTAEQRAEPFNIDSVHKGACQPYRIASQIKDS